VLLGRENKGATSETSPALHWTSFMNLPSEQIETSHQLWSPKGLHVWFRTGMNLLTEAEIDEDIERRLEALGPLTEEEYLSEIQELERTDETKPIALLEDFRSAFLQAANSLLDLVKIHTEENIQKTVELQNDIEELDRFSEDIFEKHHIKTVPRKPKLPHREEEEVPLFPGLHTCSFRMIRLKW
jgi:hypothetical protein